MPLNKYLQMNFIAIFPKAQKTNERPKNSNNHLEGIKEWNFIESNIKII